MPAITRFVTTLLLIVLGIVSNYAQVFLQHEKYNNPKAEKYFLGDRLIYKHADFPDEWRKEKIERIILDQNMIMTSGSVLSLDQIAQLRTYNEGVKAASLTLMTFGTVWLGYGGIATVADDDFSMTWGSAAFGAGTAAAGWLLQKLFYKNTYVLGDRHRVRLMDTRWPTTQE